MTDEEKVKILRRMDNAIRCLNDEESDAYITWLEEGIPDLATDEMLLEYVKSGFFESLCVLFSDIISSVITEGDINDKGFLIEFWREK